MVDTDPRLYPGFDVQIAVGNLLQLAVDERFISEEDLDPFRKVIDASTGERAVVWGGANLALFGERHCMLHRLPPPEVAEAGDEIVYCRTWPCRFAGVSFALKEIGSYVEAIASGLPGLADDLDLLSSAVHKIDPSAFQRIRSAALAYQEAEAWRRAEFPHATYAIELEPPWTQTLELSALLENARTQLLAVAERVRMEIGSHQLKQGWSPRGGRSGELLLTAVWQHLDSGGFSPREIARLAPDLGPGGEDAMVKRVRKRLRTTDHRTDRPRDPAIAPPASGEGRPRRARGGRN